MAQLNITIEAESDGGLISYADAKYMVDEYQKNIDPDNDIQYFRIKAEYLRHLTQSNDCEYVSLYFGLHKNPTDIEKAVKIGHTLILIGVDKNGDNIVDKSKSSGNVIYEHIKSCPPCGKSLPLKF